VVKQLLSILDLIQAARSNRNIFIHEDDTQKTMQAIADLLSENEAFVYGNQVFIPSTKSRKLQTFNQMYARYIIARIREIQPLKIDEEVDLINELFSLLPAEISLIVINSQTYHCTGKKKAGEILTEEEILSHIIDD
jgi:hypothetical protein